MATNKIQIFFVFFSQNFSFVIQFRKTKTSFGLKAHAALFKAMGDAYNCAFGLDVFDNTLDVTIIYMNRVAHFNVLDNFGNSAIYDDGNGIIVR